MRSHILTDVGDINLFCAWKKVISLAKAKHSSVGLNLLERSLTKLLYYSTKLHSAVHLPLHENEHVYQRCQIVLYGHSG